MPRFRTAREPRASSSGAQKRPRLARGLAVLGAVWLAHASPLAADGSTNALPGRRIALTDGQLYVPEGRSAAGGELDVTLHLHGAAWAAEQNFVRARMPGVLVTVVLPGLSAAYAERFRAPDSLDRLLAELKARLPVAEGGEPTQVRRLTVSSFSAGYGGVREWLKQPTAFERIDALVLADSLYAGFEGEAAMRKVSAANLEGFLRFARAAAEGRKRMLVTHSQLHTPAYASTVETADYLIAQLGGSREVVEEPWPGGLRLVSRFQRGQFEVLGFAGDTGADHLRHLHQLAAFLERVRPTDEPVSPSPTGTASAPASARFRSPPARQ